MGIRFVSNFGKSTWLTHFFGCYFFQGYFGQFVSTSVTQRSLNNGHLVTRSRRRMPCSRFRPTVSSNPNPKIAPCWSWCLFFGGRPSILWGPKSSSNMGPHLGFRYYYSIFFDIDKHVACYMIYAIYMFISSMFIFFSKFCGDVVGKTFLANHLLQQTVQLMGPICEEVDVSYWWSISQIWKRKTHLPNRLGI